MKAIEPPTAEISRASSIGDPTCTLAAGPAMAFSVAIRVADTQTDNVFMRMYVNGSARDGVQLRHDETLASDTRMPPPQCVLLRDLDRACSLVEVVVATDGSKLTLAGYDPHDFEISAVSWFVLGPAVQYAGATQSDCPKATALAPPQDGGT